MRGFIYWAGGIVLAFIAWGIYLCGNIVPALPKTTATKPASTATAPPQAETSFTYTEPPVLATKNITPQSLLPKTLTLPMPFNARIAMQRLIPGNYYHLPVDWTENDTADMVEWTCPACRQTEYDGWGETSIFPMTENETTLEDVQEVTDPQGRKNYFLSLGTTEKVFPDPTCGRFSCGYLGLAWFRQRGQVCDLVAWSACVGCFGAFQHVPPIHVVALDAQSYGIYIENANGGAGGPYYGSLHLFGAHNGRFVSLLQVPDTYRGNTMTGWTTELAKAGPNKLLLRLTGNYSKYDYEDEQDVGDAGLSVIPVEIKPYTKQVDTFGFVIERTYRRNGHQYHLLGTKSSMRP